MDWLLPLPRLRKISKADSCCGPRILLLRSLPGVLAVRRCIARSPKGVNGAARGVRRLAERRADGVNVVYRGVVGCVSKAAGILIHISVGAVFQCILRLDSSLPSE